MVVSYPLPLLARIGRDVAARCVAWRCSLLVTLVPAGDRHDMREAGWPDSGAPAPNEIVDIPVSRDYLFGPRVT